jgi:hypothetical protein
MLAMQPVFKLIVLIETTGSSTGDVFKISAHAILLIQMLLTKLLKILKERLKLLKDILYQTSSRAFTIRLLKHTELTEEMS